LDCNYSAGFGFITKADGGVTGVVSNSSSTFAVGGGRFGVGADRLSLFALVVVGKLLDAVSTVTVLSLRDDVYESMWLTRTLMGEFGMVEGVLVTVVLAVAGVALLAESGELVVSPVVYRRFEESPVALLDFESRDGSSVVVLLGHSKHSEIVSLDYFDYSGGNERPSSAAVEFENSDNSD